MTSAARAMFETIDDILALLGNAEESVQLEFKSGRVLANLGSNDAKRELIKDVTGFANAGGGTIVFGIVERDEDGRSVADSLELVPVGAMTKDRLAEILSSNCDPPLTDFEISVIPGTGGSVFVLTIEEGHTAFQNRIDRRYYQRVEATTQMMYGFAIRDVMNRRTGAIVRATLDVRMQQLPNDTQRYRIIPHLANVGGRTANHWILEVDLPVPPSDLLQQMPRYYILPKGQLRVERWLLERLEYSSERSPPTVDFRLLPGYELTLDASVGLADLKFEIDMVKFRDVLRHEPPIRWILYVDDAEKQSHEMPYADWCRY
jgi:Putative DNA-binding domain